MIYSILYKVLCILIAVSAFWVGIRYVKLNSPPLKKNTLTIKQKKVKQNRQIFGISEPGAPEINKVQIINYNDLGING